MKVIYIGQTFRLNYYKSYNDYGIQVCNISYKNSRLKIKSINYKCLLKDIMLIH